MNVGDRVRLARTRTCRVLGVPDDQVGIVRDVDAASTRTTVLISFPDVDVYTSALRDDDVEVLAQAGDRARPPGGPMR